MKHNQTALISAIALVLLGLYMIYLGLYAGPRTLQPPIVTGIGFFFIAWALASLSKRG